MITISTREADEKIKAMLCHLCPVCEKVAVVGEVRRKLRQISMIEVLVIPKVSTGGENLLGDVDTPINKLEEMLKKRGKLFQIRGAESQSSGPIKHLTFRDAPLNIYITTAEKFGLAELVWTGPKDFVAEFLTPRDRGGRYVPSGFTFKDYRAYDSAGNALRTPTEGFLFNALGVPFILPENRGVYACSDR